MATGFVRCAGRTKLTNDQVEVLRRADPQSPVDVFTTLQWCELSNGHTGVPHHSEATSVFEGDNWWVCWDDDVHELVTLDSCPVDWGPLDEINSQPCGLFPGHPGRHGWAEKDPDTCARAALTGLRPSVHHRTRAALAAAHAATATPMLPGWRMPTVCWLTGLLRIVEQKGDGVGDIVDRMVGRGDRVGPGAATQPDGAQAGPPTAFGVALGIVTDHPAAFGEFPTAAGRRELEEPHIRLANFIIAGDCNAVRQVTYTGGCEFGTPNFGSTVVSNADRPACGAELSQAVEDCRTTLDGGRHRVDVRAPQLPRGLVQPEGFSESDEVCGVGPLAQLSEQPLLGNSPEAARSAQGSHGFAERFLPVDQRAVQVEDRESAHDHRLYPASEPPPRGRCSAGSLEIPNSAPSVPSDGIPRRRATRPTGPEKWFTQTPFSFSPARDCFGTSINSTCAYTIS